MDVDLREALAAEQHEIWSHWMRWMFSTGTFAPDGTWRMLPGYAERWQRQMHTAYADLSDKERVSDREQADKILVVLRLAGKEEQ